MTQGIHFYDKIYITFFYIHQNYGWILMKDKQNKASSINPLFIFPKHSLWLNWELLLNHLRDVF